jgi:hypothetical protein
VSSFLGAVTMTIPQVTGGGVSGFQSGSSSISSGLGSSPSGIVPTAIGLSSVVGALVEVTAVAATLSLVGIIIIAVVANRADPDPTGRRPHSVYFFMVSFVTITTAIFGSSLIVASLLWLTAGHSTAAGHVIARLLLISVLITLVSGTLFAVHLRRGLILARADGSSTGPSRRVGQSYVSIVAFVSVLVLLITAIVSIYLVFALAAPSTFGSFGGRAWAGRFLVESAYLALVAVVVARTHSSLLTPGLGIFGRGRGQPTGVPEVEVSSPLPPLA